MKCSTEWGRTPDPEAFLAPGDEIAGNTKRYFSYCRTDSIRNLDMNVSKTFQIKENISLELRGEFFNAFDHPNFGMPITSIRCGATPGSPCSSGSFGQFQDGPSRTTSGGTDNWASAAVPNNL